MDRSTKKKFPSLSYYIIILIVVFSFIVLLIYNNNRKSALEFYSIKFKLITSTHSSLPWVFKPVNSSIEIKVGEIMNVEYIVKNLSSERTSGMASFAYHPKELAIYINKIKCFCNEVQTLEAGEEEKYTLTMMIDPKVTKDIKTKSIKEAIMQFTFFDSKNYKSNKS